MTTTYVAGELATLVTDEGVVVSAPDRLAEVVALGGRGLESLTVADVLSRGSLADLPGFAVARIDGAELRVVVRGPYAVRVGSFVIDGRDATTWTEATTPVAPGAVVEIGPFGTTPAGPTLPLTAGVVRSAGVSWCPVVVAPPASAPVSPPVFAPASEYTAVRKAPSPAPPPPPPPPAPALPPSLPTSPRPDWTPVDPPAAPPADPDHDGRTITPAQLQALRAARGADPTAVTSAPAPIPAQLNAQVAQASAKPLVALRLSTGRMVPIRRRVLIGRSPRVQQVGGSANLPALVTVDDPYVSGTHLEVAAEGLRVTVTDTSTNGTLLARRGGMPVQLDRGVATEIAVGDVLTLSKGLTATLVRASDHPGGDGR